jgi:serine/threonine-protein kinase
MIGQMVGGKYEIVEELGSDSVFDLFKAIEKSSSKEYFVRVIEGSQPRGEEFTRQVHGMILRLKSVNHHGVERLLSAHQESNGFFIVSAYAPGSVLDGRLRKLSSIKVQAAVSMAIEICEGLQALHSANLVHGDVSPRTVLSTSNEGAKLLLPGMWMAYGQDHDIAVAMHHQMAPYLAPEVSAGDMPTAQSDIYALGVLMWQILVGRLPYYGDNVAAITARHASDPYPSLRMVAATVPMALDEIIKKCLDKNPLRRYGSARDLLHDLTAINDALRFGRKITWPIQGAVSQVPVESVAPELNAVDGEPQEKAIKKVKAKKEKDMSRRGDGIPAWLSWIFYLTVLIFLCVVAGWLFFNSQKAKILTVPNLTGKQTEEARTELKRMGLKLREVEKKSSEQVPEGAIIDTRPGSGEEIRQGRWIEAVVSKGSKFVEVPDFRGMSVDEARRLAEALNLPISDTDIERVRDRELEEGLIVSQVPEARKKVERFTKVRLKISNGDRRVGSTRGLDRHTNRVNFSVPADIGKDVVVRIDVTDAQGTKTLFEQVMSPGQEVDERVSWLGDELLIRIFFDGELIEQKTATPEDSEENE